MANGQRLSSSTELLEDRTLLASDFGDAPDTSAGTGVDDYQTLTANAGPSHTIVAGLFLGARVDADDGTLQNSTADADDQFTAAGSDDEDCVLYPQDLVVTIGAMSTITLVATNTTGTDATLAGWIDYNRNGVFDNVTERATITVGSGADNERFTLTFPIAPIGSEGVTFARFRLSTDAVFVADPSATGTASDGEVEDYAFSIRAAAATEVDSSKSRKLASLTNGAPFLFNEELFGSSIANVGDIDGDGITDLAVGSLVDDTGGPNRGAVRLLFLNANGSVKSSTKIASGTPNGPVLSNYDLFGIAVSSVGDIDGDGIPDLAVGATGDDTGGTDRGAVHLLTLNSNGTVKNSTKIAHSLNGGPSDIVDRQYFGGAITDIGDLDGDGVGDLAVGAGGLSTGRGSVYILMMNADRTVKSSSLIRHR